MYGANGRNLVRWQAKSRNNHTIKQIQLSDFSAVRKIELLTENFLWKLDQRLKNAPCISLAIDKLTGITDNTQLYYSLFGIMMEIKKICAGLVRYYRIALTQRT